MGERIEPWNTPQNSSWGLDFSFLLTPIGTDPREKLLNLLDKKMPLETGGYSFINDHLKVKMRMAAEISLETEDIIWTFLLQLLIKNEKCRNAARWISWPSQCHKRIKPQASFLRKCLLSIYMTIKLQEMGEWGYRNLFLKHKLE